MSRRDIGFIGLGRMGTPMTVRLLSAGFGVTGFDVSAEARSRLADAGGAPVAALLDLPSRVDALILMLPDSAAVESVLLDSQLLTLLAPGTIIIDMSSSEPMRTRALFDVLAGSGHSLVDAPVSGGVKGATAGTLAIMAGGPNEVVDAIWPILSALGTPTHVGGTGAGHAVKALNNLMSATHLWATSEAMLAGIRFGLDPGVMLSVINGGSGRSGSTENKWPNFVLTGKFNSGFALRLMLKDITIAKGLLENGSVDHRLSDKVLSLWAEAARELPSDADHTEVARWLAERGPRPTHLQAPASRPA